jgi:hypothetical protein
LRNAVAKQLHVVPDKTATAELHEVHEEAEVLQETQLAEQAVHVPEPFIKNPEPHRHCPDEFGFPEKHVRH